MKLRTGCELPFAVVLFFAVSAVFAQEKAPSGSAERGFQIYMKLQCYTCHGTVGQGSGAGSRLAPAPVSYATFERQMRTPSRDMPPYRKEFVSDQDLADMYAYLASIKASPQAKDIPLLNF
jgi:ubiquinol-cytochrome c reductase cytochrome c subunit